MARAGRSLRVSQPAGSPPRGAASIEKRGRRGWGGGRRRPQGRGLKPQLWRSFRFFRSLFLRPRCPPWGWTSDCRDSPSASVPANVGSSGPAGPAAAAHFPFSRKRLIAWVIRAKHVSTPILRAAFRRSNSRKRSLIFHRPRGRSPPLPWPAPQGGPPILNSVRGAALLVDPLARCG